MLPRPFHFADRAGNVLQRNQSAPKMRPGILFHHAQQRFVVRPRHAAGQFGFDQIRPPAGKLRQDNMLLDAQPIIVVAMRDSGSHKLLNIAPEPGASNGLVPGNFRRIPGKIDINIKSFIVKF